MERLKKREAFERAVKAFGPWRSWGRAQHVAYGIARGTSYARMEKCSNDIPPWYAIALSLALLGVWPEVKVETNKPRWAWMVPAETAREVEAVIPWTKKVPRGPRPRPVRATPPAAVAE